MAKPNKSDKDKYYEALNRKLISALITLTAGFIIAVIALYYTLGPG